MKRRTFLGVAAALVAACGSKNDNPSRPNDSGTGDADAGPSDGWPQLVPLQNTATTPARFEATLTAKVTPAFSLFGAPTELWTYNDQFPGPLIEVNEGDHVHITVQNDLPEETTVHWHGLPVPPDMDGQPMDPIPPGGSKLYMFDLPPGFAGTFWYHPHPHGRAGYQVAHGMAGMFVIKPKDDPLAAFPVRHLFIEDLKLADDGTIADIDRTDRMNGREGNHLVVNGVEKPAVTIRPGERQRWRIVNATSARFLRLSFGDGGGAPFTLVGTDGGLLQAPVSVTEVLLSPAMRAEIIVEGGAAGTSVALQALSYDRGNMLGHLVSTPFDVLTLTSQGDAVTDAPQIPASLRTIDAYADPGSVANKLTFSEVLTGGDMSFEINGQIYSMGRIDLTSKLGVVEEWDAYNSGDMDHPLHIHGTQFQVVSRKAADGTVTPDPLLAWRDVVILNPGTTVKLRIKQDFQGQRMVHCHILEHEDQGMMATLDVEP
jgi:bilirubin oxidase